MSNRLRLLRTSENPNFEALFFTDEPRFHGSWRALNPGSGFLCDRFWRLRDDETLKVANAVGKLMLGIAVIYPEFTGIGSVVIDGSFTENDVTYKVSFFTPTIRPQSPLVNPDRTAINLIEATNKQLLALDSFYHLPI